MAGGRLERSMTMHGATAKAVPPSPTSSVS